MIHYNGSINIDYISPYFEFPSLAKVQGEPNHKYLQDIKYEIKANDETANSDLGGEKNRHIELVITPQEYTIIHMTSYVRL